MLQRYCCLKKIWRRSATLCGLEFVTHWISWYTTRIHISFMPFYSLISPCFSLSLRSFQNILLCINHKLWQIYALARVPLETTSHRLRKIGHIQYMEKRSSNIFIQRQKINMCIVIFYRILLGNISNKCRVSTSHVAPNIYTRIQADTKNKHNMQNRRILS